MRNKHNIQRYFWLLLGIFALLLTACDSSDSSAQSVTPTQAPVNGFGIASNHVHSLLALPDHVLVLATHYGTFRSEDSGKTCTQVSGGSNQLMQGVMNLSLVVSPFNKNRLYLLTQPAVGRGTGALGLYTSADQGRTWQLVNKTSNFTAAPDGISFTVAGNDDANEVYIYVRTLSTNGLKVSHDNGQHFADTSPLPFGNITNMIAIPGAPGQLLIYGSDGMARSSDSGKHWKILQAITSSIFTMAVSGPHSPIYASGDEGTFVSKDEGKTFTQLNQDYHPQLVASASQPQVLYSHTYLHITRSADGGKTWTDLPALKSNNSSAGSYSSIAVDADNGQTVFLSISYPTEVYSFNLSDTMWTPLTPKA